MEQKNQADSSKEDSTEPHTLQILFKNLEDIEEIICEDFTVHETSVILEQPNTMCMWDEATLNKRIIPLSRIEEIRVVNK